ncbi:uDP-N-acetylmuramate--L-alanine ligase [Faecalibacterium sp. CAG:1138]|nr:uDP-N-acetylmuramate--L-alanine ligase [Faecalibacterium sp. CAG:1138]
MARIHFVGAGGASMSVLMQIESELGHLVTGSDRKDGERLQKLKAAGYDVYVGHNPEYARRADEVVFTGAAKITDPEISAAAWANVKTVERGEFLADVCDNFKKTVAVSGTHGKTTVTALLSECFKNAGKKFCAHVGGEVNGFSGGFFFSGTDYMLTEACEYRKSFLHLKPLVAVVLNVEPDHSDTYKTKRELEDAFFDFANKTLAAGGTLVVSDEVKISRMQACASEKVMTYGFEKTSSVYAENVCEKGGFTEFDVWFYGRFYGRVKSCLHGLHNVMNALALICVCAHEQIDKRAVMHTLTYFSGVKCRYEHICEVRGNMVVSDYAHHPTEIRSVISVAKETGKKIAVYFQPHTYSRTAALFDEFVAALCMADEVNLVKTYSARETESDGKNETDLYLALPEGKRRKRFDSVEEAAEDIKNLPASSRLVLTVGAGDITEIKKYL